jgi:hypothetical protein
MGAVVLQARPVKPRSTPQHKVMCRRLAALPPSASLLPHLLLMCCSTCPTLPQPRHASRAPNPPKAQPGDKKEGSACREPCGSACHESGTETKSAIEAALGAGAGAGTGTGTGTEEGMLDAMTGVIGAPNGGLAPTERPDGRGRSRTGTTPATQPSRVWTSSRSRLRCSP